MFIKRLNYLPSDSEKPCDPDSRSVPARRVAGEQDTDRTTGNSHDSAQHRSMRDLLTITAPTVRCSGHYGSDLGADHRQSDYEGVPTAPVRREPVRPGVDRRVGYRVDGAGYKEHGPGRATGRPRTIWLSNSIVATPVAHWSSPPPGRRFEKASLVRSGTLPRRIDGECMAFAGTEVRQVADDGRKGERAPAPTNGAGRRSRKG